ncbi:MAG: hypothetical protein AAGD11_15310 [Planctomycetota bacterium]
MYRSWGLSFLSSFAALAVLPISQSAANLVVFSDDFDTGPVTSSGVSGSYSGEVNVNPVGGYAGVGSGANQFGGNFLQNMTGGVPTIGTAGLQTTLTLTNLPAHTSIDLDFLLATIDSWDGIDGASGVTGDYFNVHVDGQSVFRDTFAQSSGFPTNAYQAPSGGKLLPGTSHVFGIVTPDGAWDMSLDPLLSNIPHTGSTLVIDIFADGPGWQGARDFSQGVGGPDEGWAIDNLSVTIDAVPEPSAATCCLAILALACTCRTSRTA